MTEHLTRRDFVKGVAAAASVSVMTRAAAQGSAANGKVKAGVIGLGGRGNMIAGMLKKHGGYDITAICDYFPEVADEAGETLGVAKDRRFSGLMGYKRLLDTDVEAVFLETPPYCFPDHVEAAVDAGRHVYMAKPIACDVPGTLRVRDAAAKSKANKKVFLIDFQKRTDELIIEGVERVHRGEVGKVAMVSSLYTDDSFPDPAFTENVESRLRHLIWVNDIALGGGYLVNAGIHAVDVALWIAGERPIAAMGASAIARNDPHGDSEDVYSVTYEFANGVIVNHRGEHLKNRFDFHCDCVAHCQNGFLETAYNGPVRILGMGAGWRGGDVKTLYTRGAEKNIAMFHEVVGKGDCANPTVEPSVNATLATMLGAEACQRRTRLTWDAFIAENKSRPPDLKGLKA